MAKLTAEEMIAEMHLIVSVTLQVRDKICGGTPKHPDTIQKWIDSIIQDKSKVRELAEQARRDMGVADLTDEQVAQMAKGSWNGFRSDADGLYIEARQVKAALKEAADPVGKRFGVWALGKHIAERMFVQGREIYLGASEPDGYIEGTIHIEDRWGGAIAALKRVDYVLAPRLEFSVRLLDLPYVTSAATGKKSIAPVDMLRALLHYGQDLGLGADRSQGQGTYDVVSVTINA